MMLDYKIVFSIDSIYLSRCKDWYDELSQMHEELISDEVWTELLSSSIRNYLKSTNLPIREGDNFGFAIKGINLDLAFEVKYVVYYPDHIYLQLRCDELES